MSCRLWDEEIVLWTVGDAVSAAFLAHLGGCGRCQRELVAMRAAKGELVVGGGGGGAAAGLGGVAAAGRGGGVGFGDAGGAGGPAYVPVAKLPVMKKALRREPAVTMKILTDDPEVVILLLGDAE